MNDCITLVVNGAEYASWSQASIKYAADAAARSFDFTVADVPGNLEGFQIQPQDVALVYVGSDLVVNGYIDVIAPSFDASNHTMKITGRSKSADMIDTSATHSTGQFKDKTALDIAKEIDHYGVGVESPMDLDKHRYFQINQGEKTIDAIDRLARADGFLIRGKADGGLILERAGDARMGGALIEGMIPILSGSSSLRADKKFSDVTVKGQNGSGVEDDDIEGEGIVKNDGAKRYRPRIQLCDTAGGKANCTKQAEWQAKRLEGMNTSANFTCAGFRLGAELWEANRLVYVNSPKLRIDQDMSIKSVDLSQDAQGGSSTKLSLVDPRALGGDAPGKSGGKTGKSTTNKSDSLYGDFKTSVNPHAGEV